MEPVGRSNFFRPGGTLPPDAESYVERQADSDIVGALLTQELVYVLDSRQKGKSSLIVRTLKALRAMDVKAVHLDLQRLGANLSAEQWYAALLYSVGEELGLTSKLFEYWQRHLQVGPMARWFGALEKVVLPSVSGNAVIFIDEIDYVQSLPFSTDEFFAGIRELFNRRSERPELARLTFCLVGVASPSRLIQNEGLTPFNVGRRIHLLDFTRSELDAYAPRLCRPSDPAGSTMLNRILWWTGGHPYLVQMLASQLAARPEAKSAKDVDALVGELLLPREARTREPNLADTERRVLEAALPGISPEESRNRMLEAWRSILGKSRPIAAFDPEVVTALLLSGVATEKAGQIGARNRLYRKVFNRRWVRSNLPSAELDRQKAAARRSMWRVGTVAACVLALMMGLLGRVVVLKDSRDRALAQSVRLNGIIEKNAYQASIALAWDQMAEGGYVRACELVRSQSSSPDRNWEWRMLSSVFDESNVIRGPVREESLHSFIDEVWREKSGVVEVLDGRVLLDGRIIGEVPFRTEGGPFASWLRSSQKLGKLEYRLKLAEKLFAGRVRCCVSPDARFRCEIQAGKPDLLITDLSSGARHQIHTAYIPLSCQFSAHGNYLYVGEAGGSPHLYAAKTGAERWSRRDGGAGGPKFSPDESELLIPGLGRELVAVKTQDGSTRTLLQGRTAPVICVDWYDDGDRIATVALDGTARIWRLSTATLLRTICEGGSIPRTVTLGPGENSLTSMKQDGTIVEWSLETPSPIQTTVLNHGRILGLEMSPLGDRCITSSLGGQASLLALSSGQEIAGFELGVGPAKHPMAFSSDGSFVAMVAVNGDALIARSADGHLLRRISFSGRHALSVATNPQGKIVFGLREGGLALLNGPSSAITFGRPTDFVCKRLCCSPDGSMLATGSMTGEVALFDGKTLALRAVGKNLHTVVASVQFSPNGKSLAAAASDGKAYLFRSSDLALQTTFVGHWSRLWNAGFSPDGARLLTNSFDGTARVWDVASGRQLSILRHGSWVSSARWSPDGSRVVTACSDNCIHVFDPIDGFELAKLKGHEDIVFDARFSPDGKTLVSVSGDQTVRFWRTELGPQIVKQKLSVGRDPKSEFAFAVPDQHPAGNEPGRHFGIGEGPAAQKLNHLVSGLFVPSGHQQQPAQVIAERTGLFGGALLEAMQRDAAQHKLIENQPREKRLAAREGEDPRQFSVAQSRAVPG